MEPKSLYTVLSVFHRWYLHKEAGDFTKPFQNETKQSMDLKKSKTTIKNSITPHICLSQLHHFYWAETHHETCPCCENISQEQLNFSQNVEYDIREGCLSKLHRPHELTEFVAFILIQEKFLH